MSARTQKLSSRRLAAALIAAASLLALAPAGAEAARDDTILVSRVGTFGPGGDANSSSPSIAADGRFVAFQSGAADLSAEDNDAVSDIFVRDTQQGTTSYLSRASGAAGAAGDASSSSPSISADGRFVAFESGANNLSGEDNDAVTNVYVRDLQQQTTSYVSRASGAAGAAGDGNSFNSSISADGRFVAFSSDANSLSAEDNDAFRNIFVRDLQQQTTSYVSRASGAAGPAGDANSSGALISADGRFVAFQSDANNLSGEDNDAVSNIFVRDLQQQTTSYLSRASGAAGAAGDANSFFPSISADGRFVAFHSFANNLSAEDNDAFFDVYVRDLQQQTTSYVSRASGSAGAAGDASSFAPSISADGRFVAFHSDADSLSTEDNDAVTNVFVRDFRGPPPVSTAPPQLTGSAVVGGQLSCSQGSFANDPSSRSFQFRRNGAPIAGASGTTFPGTYTVTDDDVGQALDCVVTASNFGGSASAASNVVFPPAPGPPGQGQTGPPGPAGEGQPGPPGQTGPPGRPFTSLFAFIAEARLRAVSGRRFSVPYLLNAPASVLLEIRRGRTRVARISGRGRFGGNRLTVSPRAFGRRAPRPGRYALTLTALSAGGQRARDTATLTIARPPRRRR